MLATLPPERRAIVGQLFRFLVSGGITTGLYAVVYGALARSALTTPQVANICGYLAAVVTGYLLHSRWSFRDHGSRDRPARTTGRFFIVSLVSYGLNALFVFVLTDSRMLAGEWWWPLLPICSVTPLVTFTLNRQWVFR